jgi:alpha-glucosidase (family GH31 glycosyl hydrolase)
MINRAKYLLSGLILLFAVSNTWAQQLNFTVVEPGIWKAEAGNPEAFDLLRTAGAIPYHAGLAEMGDTGFPLSKPEITATVVDGKTYLRFPLDKNEQLYGFGLNFQTVHQRGKVLTLHVDNYAGKDDGHTHCPTPFYVSSKGYGVFINSARYIKVYAGTAVSRDSKIPAEILDRNTDKNWKSHPYSDAVEMLVPAEGAEIYIIGGPTTMDAIRRYNLLNGGGCLPPRWGLGFTQRMQRLTDANGVAAEAKAFEEKGYPLDFIGLEPGWQSKAYPCTFEWDKTRFPDAKGLVQDMLKKGVRINLWTNPYISPDAPVYAAIKPYTANYTVWNGAVADISMPQARSIFFGGLEKNKIDIGVSGYKIDEVDGGDTYLWPDVALFPSGHSAEQMRQTYGLMMQRYTTELYHQRNQRTYGLVRASNGGGSSFPYVIYNDYYDHRDFITALINSGFAGVLWTPEVRASKTAEEWLRRFQSNIFSPMAMINAWSSGTKPWTFPEVAEQVKQLANLRMQMMPYWYSEFAKYHFKGIPPFRAMELEPGFMDVQVAKEGTKGKVNLEENPYENASVKEVKDQYMAGENLLVAPVFTGETSRKVILPKGKWFDFYTGKFAGDGEVITVTPGLDKIPVYVKDGGIIPLMPAFLHAPKAGRKVDIEVRYYGDKPGTYSLYDDDGETFNYEKGEYSFREIRVRKVNGKLDGTISNAVAGKPNTVGKVTFKMMTE